MKSKDIYIFNEMKKMIEIYMKGEIKISYLSNKLLEYRDALEFFEDNWDYNFTQHVATLDSASTYIPKTQDEEIHLSSVIAKAINEIKDLITEQLKTYVVDML